MSAPFHYQSCTSPTSTLQAFLHDARHCSAPTTPLTYLPHLVVITVVYLVATYLLHKRYGTQAAGFATTRVFVLVAATHNVFLSLSSVLMHVAATRAIVVVARSAGLPATVCAAPRTAVHAQVQLAQYVFYLSKFYELLDTALLVVRGRPLTVLHVWHHASVVYEAWLWLEDGVVVGVYGMWFNTLVHVFMYAYYAAALLKIRFPWKRMITATQMVQFVTGFASLVPYAWLSVRGEGCRGKVGLAVSALINASYLGLFVRFYNHTYKGNGKGKGKGYHVRRRDERPEKNE